MMDITPPKGATPAPKTKRTSSDDDIAANIKAAQNAQAVKPAESYLPTMHNGGPVLEDGPHNLKAGEHVLTAAEAKLARKHALMASGIKSLAKEGKAKKEKS